MQPLILKVHQQSNVSIVPFDIDNQIQHNSLAQMMKDFLNGESLRKYIMTRTAMLLMCNGEYMGLSHM